MDEKYFPKKIERKWQRRWDESKTFETTVDDAKDKFYALEMLPYPSGRLHMGHVRNYSIGDALAWYKRLQGFNVLHPIGWDSFGQPAEQAAIKKGVNPRDWTEDNIRQMREQLKRLGISYEWSREIAAHRPEYYKFDQWFFLKMLELGLAYKKMTKVNWCPKDQTTLSNEQASGGVCWRCGTAVEKKDIAQWFLRITHYAEELLQGMSEIEAGWSERVLTMQKNWIGKSEGAFVEFKVAKHENAATPALDLDAIRVFTTRIDTIYGVNAVVVAAEHPLIEANYASLPAEVKAKIEEIKVEKAKPKDYDEEIEKDGIDTGLKAVNPFSNETLPVWIGNYVMMEYGTGAVMSVPAHDERDFEFARRFKLPIKQVIAANPGNTKKKSGDTENNISGTEDELSDKIINTGRWGKGLSDQIINTHRLEDVPSDQNQKFSDQVAVPSDQNQKISHLTDAQSDISNEISDISNKISELSDDRNDLSSRRSNILNDRSDEENNLSGTDSFANLEEAFTGYGFLINSGEWNGRASADAKREMTAFAEASKFGERATTYRLRDWGISRQRFWGAPIPIIYCADCGTVPVDYADLPVELPESAPFTGVGESPLAKVPEFVDTICPKCGKDAQRETDTMDTFVDSTWYYFRYTDPHNKDAPFDAKTAAYWTPVDQYIGGVDHAVMHLLYTRFWTKVMRDIGLVSFDEPVKNLLTQGMVIGESYYSKTKESYVPLDEVNIERDERGRVAQATLKADNSPVKVAVEKMSKSKYNGVDPDEMVNGASELDDGYGADATRLFVLFAAPAENELVWKEEGVEGTKRFLQKVWRFVHRWRERLTASNASLADNNDLLTGNDALSTSNNALSAGNDALLTTGNASPATSDANFEASAAAKALRRKTHQTIKRVTESFESFQFNTPVAALMELSNALGDFKVDAANATESEAFAVKEAVESLILMLAPYAPHVSEELWSIVSGKDAGILASGARFPVADDALAKRDEIEIPIQVNGKLRSRINAAPETANAELEAAALADLKVREFTDGKQIVKVVVVPNRLVNVVVK